jgi:pilus assembly protein CpaE
VAKIRVAIVDDVQESRDNIERLLKFEGDIEIVGSAARGQEAIELAYNVEPDIMLMDVNMPDMDGVAATTAISAQFPNIGVIMMSVLNEPDLLRRSMLAGAREFLVKPFSLDELQQSVRSVHRLTAQTRRVVTTDGGAAINTATPSVSRPTGRGKIISLVSLKGGVGRSVIASNFAVALKQQSSQRVALVDANISFGDIAVMMNVSDAKTLLDAVPYLRNVDADLMSTIVEEHASGVGLLLAPPSPQEAEAVTSDLVRSAITVLAQTNDFVVVDTRPSFDDLNLSIFDMSDLMLLVVTMDMTAIKDARQFLEVTELLGYDADRVRLVLNRNNTLSGIPADEIGVSLKRALWARIPDEPGPVQRSINEGIPLVTTSNESKVAEEISRMASELLAELNPDAAQSATAARAPKSGLVGRLRVALRNEPVAGVKRSA